jgi:chromosome segregation ATPase
VLREKLEYVVVSQVEDGLNAVAYLRDAGAGRGSFIPLHPRVDKGAVYSNGSGNGHTGSYVHLFGAEGVQPLLEVLNVDPRYRTVAESLLGEAVLAPSLEVAFQLWQQNGALHTFVTLEGDVISLRIVSGGNEDLLKKRYRTAS